MAGSMSLDSGTEIGGKSSDKRCLLVLGASNRQIACLDYVVLVMPSLSLFGQSKSVIESSSR